MRSTGGLPFLISSFRRQWHASTEIGRLPDGGIENWFMAMKASALFLVVALGVQLCKWFAPDMQSEPGDTPWALGVAAFFLVTLIVEFAVIQVKKAKLKKISCVPGSSISVDFYYANYPVPLAKLKKELGEFAETEGITDIKDLVVENHGEKNTLLVFTGTKDGETKRFTTEGTEINARA